MRRAILFIVGVVVIIALAVVQFLRPVPKPVLAATIPTTYQVPGTTHITLPTSGQAAIMATGVGVIASTPNQSPSPTASLAKMMTAYIVLKTHPMAIGADGPNYTVTSRDVKIYNQDVAAGDSVMKVSAGETLTERQLLEGLLLPSGDNIANLLATWISGSEAAFVQNMNTTAKSLGMTQTHYADASGADPATVSTALDQLKVANADMSMQAFRSIVSMPQATMPVAGTIYNVNDLIGKQGIVGIKTGSTNEAGGCFASAMYHQVGNQQVLMLGVIMGQTANPMLQSALNQSLTMLHQLGSQLTSIALPQTQGVVGKYTMPWNHDIPAVASKSVTVIGYPGMTVHFNLSAKQILTVQAGEQTVQVPVYPQSAIPKASLKWRLIRL